MPILEWTAPFPNCCESQKCVIEESDDVVQDAMLEFWDHGPRFVPTSLAQLRALLGRIVANTVADQGKWFRAARRRMAQEAALGSTELGHHHDAAAQPADAADAADQMQRLRLALELLADHDRRVLVLREWDRLEFAAIGAQLGLDEEAARAACRRATVRLGAKLVQLRRGDVDAALQDDD